MMRGLCRGLALLASGSVLAGAAHAQESRRAQFPPGAVVQPLPRDDGERLRSALTALAANPNSVDALIGAGRAALEAGDPQAALTFFGKADELSPRNGRVKAGMATAILRLGQPQPALMLFAESMQLGAPEAEIAADRGLAFDMIGDPRRAQQDYALVLRRGDQPEVRRRLALSLAISGERAAALRAIDAQLRQNDRAAWRTQAFVLALTGDESGAARTARGLMPPANAQAMTPFFSRLADLTPAEKAMAVHFGQFPARPSGSRPRIAATADPGAVQMAMNDAADSAPAATPGPRRRPPGSRPNDPSNLLRYSRANEPAAAPPAPSPAPPSGQGLALAEAQTAASSGRWAGAPAATPPAPSPASQSAIENAVAAAQRPAAPPPAGTAFPPPPSPSPPAPPPTSVPAAATASPAAAAASPPPPASASTATMPAGPREIELPASSVASPGFSLSPTGTQPAPTLSPPAVAPAEAPATGLAEIAALVESLPVEARPAPPPPRRPEPRRESAAAARPAPARTPPARRPAARPAHPSRHWVQIAGGADKSALPREFTRLRAQAPDQLGRRTAYTTPLRATNRLLVGPFDSNREAQEFVNQLAARNVTAFAWTSPEGQEIERLPTGR